MSKKWGEEKLEEFTSPVKTAERLGWFDSFFYWLILGVSLWAIVWMAIKIYQLYQISAWLDTI